MTKPSAKFADFEPPSAPPKATAEVICLPKPPSPDFWESLGFTPTADGAHTLCAGVVVLQALQEQDHAALIDLLKAMAVPPRLSIWNDEGRRVLYRLDPALLPMLQAKLPDGVAIVSGDQSVNLPADWKPEEHEARSVADFTELTAADIARIGKVEPDPAVASNPLLPYSLRGQSERFRRLAIEARLLLGDVCLRGQVTIWYAGPGTGKTLLALSLAVDAVREGRIAGGNIFYINADDNGSGFAAKLQIMDDIGANMLAPGFKGLQTRELTALLHKMADQDEARGVLLIIDTVKKFASLMDKRESSAIAQAFRQVAMKGGTVLGLAHTTKNPNADGTPRYAGTSDLVDDADAVFTIRTVDASTSGKERVVEFTRVKARGDCAESAAYAYTAEKGVTYDDLLASVHPVDPMEIDTFKRIEEERSDAEIIAVVNACIAEGINTKIVLSKEVAGRLDISARAGQRLIEQYTGDDPGQHRWRFRRGERGAQVYEMLLVPPSTA